MMIEYRREQQRLFAGTALHRLVQIDGAHHDRLEARRSRQLRRAARRHHGAVLNIRCRSYEAALVAARSTSAPRGERTLRPRRPVQRGPRALRMSHFERPAMPSAKARSAGGQVVGRPSKYEMRCVCSVSGALVALPRGERRFDIVLALEIDRERQRIHHGAAAALPDIRRQRVRGVADHRDRAGRPALELDQIEPVVAALRRRCGRSALRDAGNQRFQSSLRTGTALAASSLSSIVSAI